MKFLIAGYSISILALFFYSFTQIDLGLTLTRHPFWLPFQQFFQHIGYFDRPFSTHLFIAIILILFIFYGYFLYLISKHKISNKQFWITTLITTVLLVFSYNAFSYDLFNYIFDARIITHYNQNPYEHKALDYRGDPMLSFMHWTHRLYPYGPTWILLTVPLSYIGLQYFLPTFFLFKILIGGTYLISVYFLYRIAQKLRPGKELFITALFALNPLVLVESLVSAHNDIVMIALFLVGLYFLLRKRMIWGCLFILLSIGIKFATVFMVPFAVLLYLREKKVSKNVLLFGIFCALIPVVVVSFRTQFQPWYLLYALPFAALIPEYFIVVPVFILSMFALFEYVPFLFLGNWDPPVLTILSSIRAIGIAASFVVVLFLTLRKKLVKS